jgi:hypothetical protein
MVDQRVAAEKQNGVGTPYIPPMTRRLKCRIDPEQSPYTCMLPIGGGLFRAPATSILTVANI